MSKLKSKNDIRKKRHALIRQKIKGTSDCPRLSIFKSNKHFYAQIIDDSCGKTLVSGSTKNLDNPEQKVSVNNIKNVEILGDIIGSKAKKHGIKKIVFDRSGYIYHGKIAAFADSIRKKGIEF